MDKVDKNKIEKDFVVEHIKTLKALTLLNERGAASIFAALLITVVLRFVFSFPIPIPVIVIIFLFFLVISGYAYILNNILQAREFILSKVENICFSYFLTNILLYSLIVHYIGGIEWIGIFVFFFIVVESSLLLSRKKAAVIALIASLAYITVALLEYSGIIPHYAFFAFKENSFKDITYLTITVLSGAVFGFNYVSFLVSLFSKTYRRISSALNKERERLMKTHSQLEEISQTLEIKVRARTQELEDFTKNLESQVQDRTKKYKEKVEEMEKFQKFAVGREIKMVELKEENEKLKQELEELKKKS